MSWIAFEPLSDRDREALIGRWEDDWITGREVVFGAFLGAQVVGGCGFHDRAGPNTLEIGYWVHVDHLRQGYATEMARSLTSAAFTVPGIERVEIHHDKANTRSGRFLRLSASVLMESHRSSPMPRPQSASMSPGP